MLIVCALEAAVMMWAAGSAPPNSACCVQSPNSDSYVLLNYMSLVFI
jgi:hypothetical protein